MKYNDGMACPISKQSGKDKVEPSSYRPISLTSICCKVLEHIIYLSFNMVTGMVAPQKLNY